MDPYLEGDRWIGFHSLLTNEIARQLSPQLHPRYVALVNRKDVRDGAERVPHFWVEVQRLTQKDLELVTVIEGHVAGDETGRRARRVSGPALQDAPQERQFDG